MLAKCANPECSSSFRYLHEGKIFSLETTASATSVLERFSPGRIELFWLCDSCSLSLGVVSQNGAAAVQPLSSPWSETASAVSLAGRCDMPTGHVPILPEEGWRVFERNPIRDF